jgi:hypothetical protein
VVPSRYGQLPAVSAGSVFSQEGGEVPGVEAWVPHLEGIAQRDSCIRRQLLPAGHALSRLSRQELSVARVARQHSEKGLEALSVVALARRELPEDGAKLAPRRSTPEATEFASGSSTSRSFFMWLMERRPSTAKTKCGGVTSNRRR